MCNDEAVFKIVRSCLSCIDECGPTARRRILHDAEPEYQLARMIRVGWATPTEFGISRIEKLRETCIAHADYHYVEEV